MRRFLVAFLILITACASSRRQEFKPKGEARVKRGIVRLEITATGAVKPQVGAQVKVGARISGKVERLYVQAGDVVKKGQLIAVIEHKDLEAQMLEAKYKLEAAKAKLERIESTYPLKIKQAEKEVAEAEANLRLARLNYQRILKVYLDGLIAKSELDKAKRDIDVARARVKRALKALAELKKEFALVKKEAFDAYLAAKEAYKAAKVRYSYAFIYSPIDGVVSSVSTQQGETVVAGLNAPTFITVIDLSKLQVDAYVDETDIGKVKPGQKATFVVDAYPNKVFEGVVKTIYPGAIVRNNVVFYDTQIEIKTPYVGLLKPEMTADVTIIAGEKEALYIPASAVKVGMDGKSYVMVKENGKWVKRVIETGWESEGRVEVVKGLKEGEVVAIW